ncbi:MAG: hypothetical protein M9911_11120 [Saprospiraceae bacterium]|nr:hypothetical protein [Saprospiraceae bacterium]
MIEAVECTKDTQTEKDQKTPSILSRQDVIKIIEHAANIKQQVCCS